MQRREVYINEDFKIITLITGTLKQNCFIIKHLNSSEIILIDPGDDEDSILKIIKEEGNLLKHVYLTHAHYDHVGAVKKIVDHYNIPYYIHSADLKLLKRASLYSISMENRDIPFSDNYQFYDTEMILWVDKRIEIIPVPGHTPGSVAIKIDDLIFSGDLILMNSDDITKLPGYNVDQSNKSIEFLVQNIQEDSIFFLGHGENAKFSVITNHLSKLNK